MLRILQFGETGQVAREMARRAGPDVVVEAHGRELADLADPAACAALIRGSDAEVVVNAAAYTAVDKAEEETGLAMRVNGETPGAMAAAAADAGKPFLHISTDYVFDGAAGRPWREGDAVRPINAYGASKLAGEAAVLEAGGAAVVLRTAWVFSSHGANFVKTMLRVGAANPTLRVVDDQLGGPTPAAAIADALLAIAQAFKRGEGAPGVYHFAGAPTISWAGFAREIFTRAAIEPRPVVEPIATEDWPTPAARPRNSALDCQRILETYGLSQPDWAAALDEVIAELEGRPE